MLLVEPVDASPITVMSGWASRICRAVLGLLTHHGVGEPARRGKAHLSRDLRPTQKGWSLFHAESKGDGGPLSVSR
jgi:hypothetical protein